MSSDPPLVLTVDDDPDLAAIISLHVRRWRMASAEVASAEALQRFLEQREPEVVLLDVMLGDADGSRLVADLKARHPDLPVIMITRSTSVQAAVRCMRHGASDYITKPLDFDRLERAVRSALELRTVSNRVRSSGAVGDPDAPHGMIGRSPGMRQLYQLIENVASTDVSALILGETGTGKELVARALHAASARRDGPFVAVNAAAIPHELIESSLFGHEKGAFTGAHQSHVGFCERADGGTLLLDEIGEMDIEVQAKLLRFLQDHEVQRIGGKAPKRVDVRVLAATNIDPARQIASGRLREDLYYRLRVVSLRLPPLRERSGDLALLAAYFLERAAERYGYPATGLSGAALEALEAYSWPGNVRELENVLEEAVVLYKGEEIQLHMLSPEVVSGEPSAATPQTPETPASPALSLAEQAERDAVVEALARGQGDPEAAAVELGVSRATLYRRLKKYGLPGRRGQR